MNVKMWIDNPKSRLFKKLDRKKHEDYQGGFEPIPDVVIFRPGIDSNWQRRNRRNTLLQMLVSIEVKASERANSRLQPGEVCRDIGKLAAQRQEVERRGSEMYPVIMVIDSARPENERMTSYGIDMLLDNARKSSVGVLYCSPTRELNTIGSASNGGI
jgi:hypothetical protein